MKVFLGLGSNLGNRVEYIERAIEEIGSLKDTKIIKKASLYETEPWGFKEQPDFINSAVEIETMLSAEELFNEVKSIEQKLKRKSKGKWQEREIDIDILFYGNEIIKSERINIPHKEIEKRKFVLIPMYELAPDFVHPVFNETITELLSKSGDALVVKKYEN
ncbi:MAG TPA: 2-amino-4-hydroxy-6-hydroxymethyldihydropteridine diphosphokinase [Ignavibacteria bacterium]|nr:2-amino-4-hydroxy-6-hydroxymethyldihydropteridine diphosphokinase [Ignavibacteria bacterium]